MVEDLSQPREIFLLQKDADRIKYVRPEYIVSKWCGRYFKIKTFNWFIQRR